MAACRRKRYYDIRVKDRDFQPRMWVWYYYPRRYPRKSPKWQKTYIGPYLILSVLPPSNAVLQKSKESSSFLPHFDKLKVSHGTALADWRPTTTTTADVSVEDNTSAERPPSVQHQPTEDVQPTLMPADSPSTERDVQQSSHQPASPRLRRCRRRPKRFDDYHMH